MKRVAIVSLLALFAAGCQDAGMPTGAEPGLPVFLISDGATEGNLDFWFLPPVADNPDGNREFEPDEFNPNLMPTVRICPEVDLVDGRCPDTADEGKAALDENHYHFDWKTAKSASGVFRVEVLLGTIRLGFFDAEVTSKGKSGEESENVPVKAGSNIPVKFSIENNAVCIALDPEFDPATESCATATLAEGESLALQDDTEDVAIASVDDAGGETATINLTTCADLRERETIADGRVDIPTFGPCIEIENLEAFLVAGTATVCDAFDEAIAAGLSSEQAERMTVHRWGVSDDAAVALPHADAAVCNQEARAEPNRLELLAARVRDAVRDVWLTTRDYVVAWLSPRPLLASAALCNKGGCGGSSDFESSFQAALPAWMDFHPDNPAGNLGAHVVGTVVTGKIQVWDSGELEDDETVAQEPVDDLRLTVAIALGSNGTIVGPETIFTDTDGIATFQLEVGLGTNTVVVSGIGVGTLGLAGTYLNVFGPSINDDVADCFAAEPGGCELATGTLTFTAEALDLVGDAAIVDDKVRLASAAPFQTGAAWLQDKQLVQGGFTASFSFEITSTGGLTNNQPNDMQNGADGFAFVIQNQSSTPIGAAGGGIGYDGITSSLAVEFDTWLNPWPMVDDPDGNHISVHTEGSGPNSSDETSSIGLVTPVVNLSDGAVHTVDIDYTPGTLEISLDGTLVLTVSVDLTDIGEESIVDENGKAWLGLTGATGAAFENHDVFDIQIEIP